MHKALLALATLTLLSAGCSSSQGALGVRGLPTEAPTAQSLSAWATSVREAANLTATARPTSPTSTATATPAPSATRPGPVTNDIANLRSGPGANYPVVGLAKAGQALEIVAASAGAEWYRLANGQWISAQLVANPPSVPTAAEIPPTPAATAAPPPAAAPTRAPATSAPTVPPSSIAVGGNCTVNEGIANIRTGPGTGYPVRIMLSKGTIVKVVEKNAAGDWLNVSTPFNVTGWIYAPYCN